MVNQDDIFSIPPGIEQLHACRKHAYATIYFFCSITALEPPNRQWQRINQWGEDTKDEKQRSLQLPTSLRVHAPEGRSVAPAADSQKIWQPLGLTTWAGCCPQTSRALRVSAAGEQCLENDVLYSESPSGRPETRATATLWGNPHLLPSQSRQAPGR